MSITWHIVRKDLRRLWPLAAALLVVELIRILGAHAFLAYGNVGSLDGLTNYADTLLLVAEILLLLLFASALVQEDSLVSDRAFWLSRPISGTRLLAAKALSVLLLLAASLALKAGWWLSCGLEMIDITESLIIALCIPALLMLLSTAAAAVTRTTVGALMAVVAITAAGVLYLMLIETVPPPTQRYDTARTPWLVCLGVVFLTGAIVNQSVSRHLLRTLCILMFGASCIVGVERAAALRPPPDQPEQIRPLPDLDSVRIFVRSVEGGTIDEEPTAEWAQLNFDVTGIPIGWHISATRIKIRGDSPERTLKSRIDRGSLLPHGPSSALPHPDTGFSSGAFTAQVYTGKAFGEDTQSALVAKEMLVSATALRARTRIEVPLSSRYSARRREYGKIQNVHAETGFLNVTYTHVAPSRMTSILPAGSYDVHATYLIAPNGAWYSPSEYIDRSRSSLYGISLEHSQLGFAVGAQANQFLESDTGWRLVIIEYARVGRMEIPVTEHVSKAN